MVYILALASIRGLIVHGRVTGRDQAFVLVQPEHPATGLSWEEGRPLYRSYVFQDMRMLAVTWANDARGKSAFWLHAAVRRGI